MEALLADFLSTLTRFVVRVILVAMGLVFAASLVCVLLALATLWGLRALWAKLTGRPVTPWVMRVDPGAGWNRAFKAADRWRPQPASGPGRSTADREIADVTDVQIKNET